MMRVLPVIDILQGIVVHGVAGNRAEYHPIQSRWTDSADPIAVAEALQSQFGFQRFYLADLDGILTQQPNFELYRRLERIGYKLLADAGVRNAADVGPILDSGASAAIVGLETLQGSEALREMIPLFGPERIVFSLDLRAGKPNVATDADWSDAASEAIAAIAINCGVRQMIVLDLADVGTSTGGSTAALCRTILKNHPAVTLIAGGGVRGPDDIRRWANVGISELLVASALHDGRLTPRDMAS